jgi:hypothetical protein
MLAGEQRVDGLQLSPPLPGTSDRDADYVVIRQTTRCHVDPFGLRGVWSAEDLESFIAAWQFPTVRTRRMMDIAAMHRTPRIGYDGDAEARYGQCLSVAPSRAIGSSSPLWSPGHVSKLEHIGEHP